MTGATGVTDVGVCRMRRDVLAGIACDDDDAVER